MIEAAELKRNFNVVHGDPENIQGLMQVADLHRHIGGGGDTTASRWHALHSLALQGADAVAVTNHNQLGYDAASRARDTIHRFGGRFVEIIHGVEITAKSHLFPEQDRHVLIYNAPKPRRLRTFTPLPQLLAEVADQGGDAFLAHPELGENMSVTGQEVEDLANRELPFGLEVHNGGAAQIAAWRPVVESRVDNPLFSYIERQLPQSGSNDQAKELATTYGLKGIGGTDLHGGDESFIFTCAPAGMRLFDAVKKGLSVVVESKSVPRPHPHELVIGTIGGKFSSWRMERKINRQRERL